MWRKWNSCSVELFHNGTINCHTDTASVLVVKITYSHVLTLVMTKTPTSRSERRLCGTAINMANVCYSIINAYFSGLPRYSASVSSCSFQGNGFRPLTARLAGFFILHRTNALNQEWRLNSVEILTVERTFGLRDLKYSRNLSDRRMTSVAPIRTV